MSLADGIANLIGQHTPPATTVRTPPKGWEPRVTLEGDAGTAISAPMEGSDNPDEEWLLQGWGLDPELWRIDGALGVNRWMQTPADGQWLYQYKAKVVRRISRNVDMADINDLKKRIGKHRPRKPATTTSNGAAMIVCFADLQAGKASSRGGSADLVEQTMNLIGQVSDRWKQLRKAGRPLDTLVVAGLGDIIEACDRPVQTGGNVDLSLRDQLTVARRLIVKALTAWSVFAPTIIVPVVGGNHGEARIGGQKGALWSHQDNHDLGVFEQAADVLQANPDRYGHVRFQLATDGLTTTVDVAGTRIGFAHGHQFRTGTGIAGKATNWWKAKHFSRTPVGDADILVTAHYHHLAVSAEGARTWVQATAMESPTVGSEWFEASGGAQTVTGMTTFVVSDGHIHDLTVLRGEAK